MSRPLMIEVCCCAGSSSMGWHQAGFEVIGVDISPQPEFPFEFHQRDAVEFIRLYGGDAAVITGGPPCQKHTRLKHYNNTSASRAKYDAKWKNLIPDVRAAMIATGKPYVIENVELARPELRDPILLCGSMFEGLRVYRHRLFESNVPLAVPDHPRPYHPHLCTRNGYLPTPERPFMSIHGGKHSWAWQRKAAEVIGAPWIGQKVDRAKAISSVCEAIPPAYTEYLGKQLLEAL